MAGYYKTGEMKWMTLTLYGSSFLRFLLNKFGYTLEDGMILVADNEMVARKFVVEYCAKANGVLIQNSSQKGQSPEEHQCGFLIMQKGLKEEKIADFLFEQKFLPILVVGGMLPESFRTDRYIFRLKNEDVEDVCNKEMKSKIKNFYLFIINNVEEICNILTQMDSSILLAEYEGRACERNIFSVFAGIGTIYAAYLRKTYSEREVADFLEDYMQETKERLSHMEEFASGEELSEMLSALVWQYIEQNKVLVADIEAIGGRVYAALKGDSAVLFDARFYYFPPGLLMKICEPLLQTASEPELKKRLKVDDIIYCNSADYTVKKDIVTVYGARERPRFLWVQKDSLLSIDNLRLEDVFDAVSENEENEEEEA